MTGIDITSGLTVTLPHHIDIVGVRVLFLASSNFGAYTCLGPRGETDYIRQIMVNEGNGGYITDKLPHPRELTWAASNCSRCASNFWMGVAKLSI